MSLFRMVNKFNHNQIANKFHSPNNMSVTKNEVRQSIDSFPSGSSGGIDGLTPQHLKEMFLNVNESEIKESNLQSLTDFLNLVLSGEIPQEIKPIFFSARLIALNKKDGGVKLNA